MALPANGLPQGRMSAENRKKQIGSVAADLFSAKGFNGVTTKEIAEHAGVSEAIIFRHFATKDDLYREILDQKVRQGAERMTTHLRAAQLRKDDRAFFGSLACEILEFHDRDQTLMRLLLFSALEGHDLSDIFFSSTVRETRNLLRRYIKQRMADGAFRRVDPVVAARAFVGMLLHHVQMRHIFKSEESRLSNRQIADRLVQLFLDGILKQTSQRT
jgi:TetR/AcrR family transcriptional regulator